MPTKHATAGINYMTTCTQVEEVVVPILSRAGGAAGAGAGPDSAGAAGAEDGDGPTVEEVD